MLKSQKIQPQSQNYIGFDGRQSHFYSKVGASNACDKKYRLDFTRKWNPVLLIFLFSGSNICRLVIEKGDRNSSHPGMITVYRPGEYTSKHKPEEYIKDNIELEIRNATIAPILYLSKSIEQFGSGFKRINSLCNDVGIKFSYENRENGFKFVIYRPEHGSEVPGFCFVFIAIDVLGANISILGV